MKSKFSFAFPSSFFKRLVGKSIAAHSTEYGPGRCWLIGFLWMAIVSVQTLEKHDNSANLITVKSTFAALGATSMFDAIDSSNS